MNCSCGAGGHNSWNHSTSCLWFGCKNDPPFNNAMKMQLQDKAWKDATGEDFIQNVWKDAEQ